MKPALKILILEDSIEDADLIQRLLKKENVHCEFRLVMTRINFLDAFEDFYPDVILSDNSLPQFNSSDALKLARQRLPHIPFILVTGNVSEDYAVNIIKLGADDYILKDRMSRLPTAINTALKQRIAEKELALQNLEKDKRAAELITANKELIFQNEEKEKRAAELIIANNDLKKSEEMIKEREQSLSSIYDTVADSIFVLEVEKNERYLFSSVNKAFLTTTGILYDSIVGKYVNDIVPMSSLNLALEKYKEAISAKKIVRWEETSDYPNGSLIGEVSISPLFDKAGNCIRLIGAVHDITERKKMEEELRQEQYLMQTLMKNLPDHIYFKDNESRFIRISNSHSQSFNLTDPKQAIGKTDFDFFSKEHADATFIDEKTIRRTGETIIKEETETWPDKPNTYVLSKKMPFRNKEGDIIGTFGISTDITARKNAELQKEFDSNNLKALINNTNDLMWSIDRDLKLITFNDSFNKVIVLTSGKPLAKGDDILSTQFTEERVKRYQLFYQRALAGEAFTIIDHFDFPAEFWAEVSFYPISNGDIVVGTACFSHDITERKKSEETLREMAQEILGQQVQEQKKITRAIIKAEERERNHIGQELHDNVNQILAVTKIYLGLAGKDDEKVKELLKYPLELIDNSINEIRSLSSKQVTPLQDINLKELIQSLLDDLSKNPIIKTTLVYKVINEAIDDDLKLNIYRIIQEQVNNILKHAAPKNVNISVQASGKAINIVVSDDGKGFNTKAKRKGIGISNMINRIKSFDGDVAIESSPGNGCAVQIKIPY